MVLVEYRCSHQFWHKLYIFLLILPCQTWVWYSFPLQKYLFPLQTNRHLWYKFISLAAEIRWQVAYGLLIWLDTECWRRNIVSAKSCHENLVRLAGPVGLRPKARPSQPNRIFMTSWLKSITCTTKLGWAGPKAPGSGESHQARLVRLS